MLHIAIATHSLKGTFAKLGHKISDDVTVASFLNQSQQNFVLLVVILRSISVPKLSKIGQETEKLQKWEIDAIVTSFLNIAHQFLCVSSFYYYLMLCQVSS